MSCLCVPTSPRRQNELQVSIAIACWDPDVSAGPRAGETLAWDVSTMPPIIQSAALQYQATLDESPSASDIRSKNGEEYTDPRAGYLLKLFSDRLQIVLDKHANLKGGPKNKVQDSANQVIQIGVGLLNQMLSSRALQFLTTKEAVHEQIALALFIFDKLPWDDLPDDAGVDSVGVDNAREKIRCSLKIDDNKQPEALVFYDEKSSNLTSDVLSLFGIYADPICACGETQGTRLTEDGEQEDGTPIAPISFIYSPSDQKAV